MFLQLGNDLQRVARNRQLLVGRDAQHLDRGIVRADDADRAALVPVSYTHLDVYKRQSSYMLLTHNPIQP